MTETRGSAATGRSISSVGVVLALPEPYASELRRWRASFGDPLADVVPAHITLVTSTPTEDWPAVLEHVRAVAADQREFQVTLQGTGEFRPISPVVYLKVVEGFEDCVELHERLQRGVLERELSFPFHPHVTVAHDVSELGLDEAAERLSDYQASFPVRSMGLYEHDDDGVWQLQEELRFGGGTEEEG
ncbi:2'-5' RNA ligase [Psychromicrobium silvestre]|uniref:2'-5' RNA ligase n=1 Tax=Psychromicrobium silvestre TaxID=1645614 RepID=A0A7Y9S826_9MICC|nr:2'-5' RNA ligase family protein [Psychromicrobium silvestre]NYE96469.1 2'-5' RNA ligase [Psychromicrobium silvestre]